MVDHSIKSAERISALVDGQLQDEEFVQTLAELESSSEARLTWDTFHLVGDVMRSGDMSIPAHDTAFVARLRIRMNQDASSAQAVPGVEIAANVQDPPLKESANDGSWRRFAGLASLMLAGVLAWQTLHLADSDSLAITPQTAQLQASPPVSPSSTPVLASGKATNVKLGLIRQDGTSALAMASEPQVMIRDPQLDALLAAHRQVGGASAIHLPAGFLRNTTFEEGPR